MNLLHLRNPHRRGFTLVELPAVSKRGFTLVELLVVIGIIAVLVGILLPTLSNARKHASTVKCLSSLRQIGMAFNLYANFYRDAYPVVRQDTPDDGLPGNQATPPVGVGPQNVRNTYYSDMLIPFLSKTGKMNFQIGTDKLAFEAARSSVLWGCPEWQGWQQNLHRGGVSTYVNGVSIFETGYAMNMWPTYTATFPVGGTAKPPITQAQMRWSQVYHGKYYKRSQWTKPAERLLMADSTLWLLGFGPTTGQIAQQDVGRTLQDGVGQTNIDRYRHGKFPGIVPGGTTGLYARQGGKVAFNVLFADGHANTLNDIREGYKAIRMRYPG
jgi:prepilin-type N-terminal cleavage/methylation domain-containing protein/prepilin-type processing-associated H-X9-DG protein